MKINNLVSQRSIGYREVLSISFEFIGQAIGCRYTPFVYHSKMFPYNTGSSGKLLTVDIHPLSTILRCFHITWVSLQFSTASVKCLRLAFLIKDLVLLRYFLYSGHCFKRFRGPLFYDFLQFQGYTRKAGEQILLFYFV